MIFLKNQKNGSDFLPDASRNPDRSPGFRNFLLWNFGVISRVFKAGTGLECNRLKGKPAEKVDGLPPLFKKALSKSFF